jgi:hypothetical protein
MGPTPLQNGLSTEWIGTGTLNFKKTQLYHYLIIMLKISIQPFEHLQKNRSSS